MVTHPQYIHPVIPKRLYKRDKSTFDIALSPQLWTQGLTRATHLRRMCSKLAAAAPISGSMSSAILTKRLILSETWTDRIRFRGFRTTPFLLQFYSGMDIIVSRISRYAIPGKSYVGFPRVAA
jgi:hypothetical protein